MSVSAKLNLEVNEHYLKTYANHKILSEREVKRLIRQTWEGVPRVAKKAKEKLVLGNQKLVISVALKHQDRGVPLDDLIQEGNIGLLRAIEKFDPERGIRFNTHATPWIKGRMTRAILAQSLPVYMPRAAHRKALKIRRVAADLSQSLGREASIDEVVEATDEERDFCEFALSPNFYAATRLEDVEIASLEDLIDENSPDPQEASLRIIK